MESVLHIQVFSHFHYAIAIYVCANFELVLINRNPQATKRKSGIQDWHLALFVLALLTLSVSILFIDITLEGIVAKFEVRKVPSKEKPSVPQGVSHEVQLLLLT